MSPLSANLIVLFCPGLGAVSKVPTELDLPPGRQKRNAYLDPALSFLTVLWTVLSRDFFDFVRGFGRTSACGHFWTFLPFCRIKPTLEGFWVRAQRMAVLLVTSPADTPKVNLFAEAPGARTSSAAAARRGMTRRVR